MTDILALQFTLIGMIVPLAWGSAHRLYRRGVLLPAFWKRGRRSRRFRAAGVGRDLVIVGAALVTTIILFTPAASSLAGSDILWPMFTALLGGAAIAAVVRGALFGRVRPWLDGYHTPYARALQPGRFWVSMAFNTLIGAGAFWSALSLPADTTPPDLEARCYNGDNIVPPAAALAACNTLIAGQGIRDPYTAGLIAARGSALLRQGEYARAAADYVEAVRIDPTQSSTHYNLGLVDEHFEDFGLAIDDFGAALRIDPDNFDARVHRGASLMGTGQPDRAIADFTAALRIRPTNPVALTNRGLAYAWTGEYDLATRDLDAVRRMAPVSQALLHGEALVAMRTGNPAIALERLDEALRRDPGDQWSRTLRAEAYRRLGRTVDRAADLWAQKYRLTP